MEDRQNAKGDPEFDEHLESLRKTEFRNRLKWMVVGVSLAAIGVGLFAVFWNYKVFFFRPKPDMTEVKRISYQKSDDPACRALIGAVDEVKTTWKEERLSLKDLYTSTDPQAIRVGLETIRSHLKTFKYERRRVQIIITKDPNVVSDIARFIKHISRYLREMERSLTAHLISIDPEAADTQPKYEKPVDNRPDRLFIEGYGHLKIKKNRNKAEKLAPKEIYARGWSKVTDDHEKWRVFRQGAIPCGRRIGDAPPVPEEDAPLIPSQQTQKKKQPTEDTATLKTKEE